MKFEVYKSKDGGFRFRLKSANGEILATGESYEQNASCLKTIDKIKANAATATVEIVKEDTPTS